MGYDLTLQGLLRKRAELAGEAATYRAQLDDRLASLDAIDRVIRVFNPAIDLEDLPERAAPPPLMGVRGEFQRFLLDALRKADGPQSTHDLARAVMEHRGLNVADKVTFKLIAERTGNALAKLRKAGKAVSQRANGSVPLTWNLAAN